MLNFLLQSLIKITIKINNQNPKVENNLMCLKIRLIVKVSLPISISKFKNDDAFLNMLKAKSRYILVTQLKKGIIFLLKIN